MKIGNVNVAQGIRAAARAMKGANAKLRIAASRETKDLISFLRSDQDLESDDREMLADLLAGQLAIGPGHPSLTLSEISRRNRICEAVKEEMARSRKAGEAKPYQERAIALIAKRRRCTEHDIRLWLKKYPF